MGLQLFRMLGSSLTRLRQCCLVEKESPCVRTKSEVNDYSIQYNSREEECEWPPHCRDSKSDECDTCHPS